MFEINSNPTTLRLMHAFNLFAAGGIGAFMLFAPALAQATMFPGTHDPAIFGMTASIWFAVGISSIIGLFRPNLMKGLFVLQMIYKPIWVFLVATPLLLTGDMSVLSMVILFIVVYGFGWGYGLFWQRSAAERPVSIA